MEYDDSANYIDAESGYKNEKNTFDQIVLEQIRECVKVLSRGTLVKSANPKKDSVDAILSKDSRELIIDHVDTLRILLIPFTKEKAQEKIDELKKEIKEYVEDLEEKEIIVYGKGKQKVGEAGLDIKAKPMQELLSFKCWKHRKMFEVLIGVYNKRKIDIERFSRD